MTEPVKRYTQLSGAIAESFDGLGKPRGEYVKASDYDALLGNLADEKSHNEHMSKGIAKAAVHLTGAGIRAFGWLHEGIDKLAAERDDYKADYFRVHSEKMDHYEGNIVLRAKLDKLESYAELLTAPARELLFLYDWRFELAKLEKEVEGDGDIERRPELRAKLREYGERKKAGWIALRAALASYPGIPDNSFVSDEKSGTSATEKPLAECVHQVGKGQPLKAEAEGDRLVISIGRDILAHAIGIGFETRAPEFRVTDSAALLKSVARALNRESEDGSTPVHDLLDKAALYALEQGAEGFEECGHAINSQASKEGHQP